MILHTGKSRFNGENFAVVATGFDGSSKNIKTGPMIQLTILPTDTYPSQSNKDYAEEEGKVGHTVCNDCPLINRGCYVQIGFSINKIYNKMNSGNYESLDYDAFINESVRFGAWGEPTLIPRKIMRNLVKRIKNWTGYTHQWAKPFAQFYKMFFMASVSNIADKNEANKKGWRTFRIIKDASEVLPDEVICPAQTHGTQCIDCGLCNGNSTKAKNIAVIAHGGKAKLTSIMNFLKKGG